MLRPVGNIEGTMRHARHALDTLPEDAYQERGIPAALLGIAQWSSGALEAAQRTYNGLMVGFQKGGNHPLVIGGAYVLADIKMAQGRLHEAADIYQRALAIATEAGSPVIQGCSRYVSGA